jgi:hypothetical protein
MLPVAKPTETYYITALDSAAETLRRRKMPPTSYYELGWEAVTTHFEAKHLKKIGVITDADVIVTAGGREFLYSSVFPNVISYADFTRLSAQNTLSAVSLVAKYYQGNIPDDYFNSRGSHREATYRFLKEDRAIIQQVTITDTSQLHQGREYCCLLVRRRRHCANRNMSDATALALHRMLSDSFGHVFVVGLDLDSLLAHQQWRIVDLQTYVSLISNPLCRVLVGSMTGTMQLAGLLSQAGQCLVRLNQDDQDVDEENDPIRLGRCMRLSASSFAFAPPSRFVQSVARYLHWRKR